jgi:hypothetical protein
MITKPDVEFEIPEDNGFPNFKAPDPNIEEDERNDDE